MCLRGKCVAHKRSQTALAAIWRIHAFWRTPSINNNLRPELINGQPPAGTWIFVGRHSPLRATVPLLLKQLPAPNNSSSSGSISDNNR